MKVFTLIAVLFCCSVPSIFGANFVGYYPSWAPGRPGEGQYGIDNINPNLFSHLIYSFAVLDSRTLQIVPASEEDDITNGGYDKFTALKQKNPKLKTMLAIGGWEDSNDGDDKYSRLVSNSQNIDRFVQSVVNLLAAHNFDGLDVDWEYPKSEADKAGFSNLLASLRRAFGDRHILTTAIPASKTILNQGYDLRTVNRAVDFFHLMAYDFHGSWDLIADHHAPLYARTTQDENNIDKNIDYLTQQGVESGKIILGIPTYGRSFTLPSSTVTPPTQATDAGIAGEFTGEPGILAYYEICKAIQSGWTKVPDSSRNIGPYAHSNKATPPVQWVGYDDVDMVQIKSSYIKAKDLAGAMVWDVSMDDFRNVCGEGVNPLLTAIFNSLMVPAY